MNRLNPELDNLFTQLESEYNLPSNLLKSVAYTESRFNPRAVSPAGARGMFQFMPGTAKQYNVNVDDPVSSAKGAARMYSDLLKSSGGDLNQALAGYNWGIGNVQRKGMDRMPQETRNYISQINNLMGNNTNNNQSQQVNEDEEYMRFLQAREQLAQSNNPPAQDQTVNNNQSQQVNEDEEYMRFLQSREQLTQASNPPVEEQAQQVQQVNNEQPIDNSTVNQSVDNPLYQNFLKLPAEELGEYVYDLKPRERLTLEKIIQDEVRKNPALYQDSGFQNFLQGIKNTGQNWNTSLKQMGAGISDFFTGGNKTEEVNKLVRRQEGLKILHDMLDPSISRTSGEIAADVGLSLAIPMGGAVRGASAATRGAQYAGQGAIGAGLSQPVEVKENENFAEEKAKQLAVGAAVGAGAGLVLEKGLKYIGKPFLNKLSREDEEFIKLANERGYTPLASELPSASSSLQNTGQNMARDSYNIKNVSLRNQEQAVKDIEDLKNSLSSFNPGEYISKKGLDKIVGTNNPYSQSAKQVIDKLNNVDVNNPNAVFKATAEANFLTKKIQSSKLYDEATALAPKDVDIGLVNSNQVFNEILKEQQNTVTAEVRNSLNSVVKNLEDIFKTGSLDYVKADQVYKELGTLSRKARSQGDDNAFRIYNQMRDAINKDKDDFVNSVVGDDSIEAYKKAYGTAKDFNNKEIQQIKRNPQLRKIFENYDRNGNINFSDDLISKMVKKGQNDSIKFLYNKLDDESKNAIQQGVLNNLVDKATNASTGFDPQAFVKAIRNYKDPSSGNTPLSVVFDKKTNQNLTELFKIFDNINTISYARSNPQTGVQNLASLDNLPKVIGVGTSITAGSFIPLLIPAITSLRKVGIEKALTNPKLHKYVLDLKNTNPKSQKYVEKASALFSFMLSQEFANIE